MQAQHTGNRITLLVAIFLCAGVLGLGEGIAAMLIHIDLSPSQIGIIIFRSTLVRTAANLAPT